MEELDSNLITPNEFQEIAENSRLTNEQLIAALLESCGAKPKEISQRLGKSEQYVYQLRATNSDYKYIVKQFNSIVAARLVAQVADVDTLFNEQINPSVVTLMEIRDNLFARDGDRIKASLAFLDRASKAPKATAQQEIKQMIIQIPITQMKEMRKVLEEVGGGGGRALEALEKVEGKVIEEEGEEWLIEDGEIVEEEEMIQIKRM